jgi:hypothetical protein
LGISPIAGRRPRRPRERTTSEQSGG